MSVFTQIIEQLNKNAIIYDITKHKAVRTSEEAAAARGVELKTGAKSMIIKAGPSFFLLVMPADRHIDWKKAKQVLKTKDIRFASEVEAENISQVKMGSVPPFGNILNLPTYFDASIRENEYVNFNPGSVKHSIRMKSTDLIDLVHPAFADFTKLRDI